MQICLVVHPLLGFRRPLLQREQYFFYLLMSYYMNKKKLNINTINMIRKQCSINLGRVGEYNSTSSHND